MPPPVSFVSSLRSRLILLIVVAILPWIAAMAYYMWSAWQTATAAAVEEGRQLTRIIAQEEGRALQEAHNLLRVLVSLPEVRTGTEADCSASLQAIRAQTAGYVNFVVADAQGRQACAAYGSGADFSDRDWYRTMTDAPGFVVGRMVIGKLSGKPIIPTTYPVLNASGRLQRIVVASLDVAWLDRALNQRDRLHDAAISLIDAQGVVVARQPHGGALIGKPYRVEWVRSAIAARQAEGAGEARDAEGEARLLTFARLGDSGLYVVASYSKPHVLAGVVADFRGNLLFLGFFTLLTLVAAWFLAETFLRRPLLALGQAAERIAEGDFTARAGLGRARGELSEVARAFDDMAGSLERSFLQT
ncbi:MAG: cache domain-containing protein, partial [Gammaproteobacteria bacterium]